MFIDFDTDYQVSSFTPKTLRGRLSENIPAENTGQRRQRERLAFAAFYRAENARLRKPCPTCSTLVQPHLLNQHYEAYHPNILMTDI